MPIYRDAAATLLEDCAEYRRGVLPLEQLKSSVWTAASTIVAAEEKGMRDFLQAAEGRLDVIQFTTDDELVFTRSLSVVAEIEDHIHGYLGPPPKEVD